jgi:hypothetical protein
MNAAPLALDAHVGLLWHYNPEEQCLHCHNNFKTPCSFTEGFLEITTVGDPTNEKFIIPGFHKY